MTTRRHNGKPTAETVQCSWCSQPAAYITPDADARKAAAVLGSYEWHDGGAGICAQHYETVQAARPHCELCRRTATIRLGSDRVPLCTRHANRAKAEWHRRDPGYIWAPHYLPEDRAAVLEMAAS